MPSIYAHQKFGDETQKRLPVSLQKELEQNRDLFNIGFQGPDIFFFYHPLSWGEIPQYGNRMHEKSGHAFFGRALELYYGLPHETPANQQIRQAARAYLYGVLCHYTLDSACHRFIDETDASGITSHAELEGDYDRRLIAREGRNPVEENLTRQFHPSAEAAKVIAVFYPEVTPAVVETALRSCVSLQRLLRCPRDGKRNFLYGALWLVGKYESFQPHIMNKEPDPDCREAEDRLDELFEQALPRAAKLITELDRCIRETPEEIAVKSCYEFVSSTEYDRNFSGR